MKLSEIHAAIEKGHGPAFTEATAFATVVSIEKVATINKIPVHALDFAAPEFARIYPFDKPDLLYWSGRAKYLKWRSLILDAQMLFAPGDVEGDPWKSLARAARISLGKHSNVVHLKTFFEPEIHPQYLNSSIVCDVFKRLPKKRKFIFRTCFNNFLSLFDINLLQASNLLPAEKLQRLPREVLHHNTPKSPIISGLSLAEDSSYVKSSINLVNKLAVLGGLMNGQTDTINDLRAALPHLPEPSDFGIKISKPEKIVQSAISTVLKKIGGPDFRLSPVKQAWSDLRYAGRQAGCQTGALWSIARRAEDRDLLPSDMTKAIAEQIVYSYTNNSMWNLCREGCEQIDAMRDHVPPYLLPDNPIGIKRRVRPKRPKLVANPTHVSRDAWNTFTNMLIDIGWKEEEIKRLSFLRVHAIKAGINPEDMSQSFVNKLYQDETEVWRRHLLRASVFCIDELSKNPDFKFLPSLHLPRSQYRSHGGLARQAEETLEALIDFMNPAPSTRRAYRVAVGVLSDAQGNRDVPLESIIKVDATSLHFGRHERRRARYLGDVRALLTFIQLPWTPAWRELQNAVVKAGITHKDNVVPKILSWSPGTDPDGLTKEWAQRIDRNLRSSLKNPPLGRADLAVTLARQINAFDALHDIPSVAQTGLLPPRIGPIR